MVQNVFCTTYGKSYVQLLLAGSNAKQPNNSKLLKISAEYGPGIITRMFAVPIPKKVVDGLQYVLLQNALCATFTPGGLPYIAPPERFYGKIAEPRKPG